MDNISGYIVFFSQVIICYIIILTSLSCIVSGAAITKEYSNLFLTLTSSAVGYLLPSPTIKTETPPTQPIDVPDNQSIESTWNILGKTIPKSAIVFFAQVFICYIIIIVCITCLAIGKPSTNDYLFTILTSSTLGILLPSPKLKVKKNGFLRNTA